MIESGTITGTIESNNGTEALVSFADGAQQLFERSTESEADFLAAFPVGGTARAKPFVGKFATHFALARGGQCEWLELTEENFEYVCGEIANANN